MEKAVKDLVTPAILEQAAGLWNAEPESLELLGEAENFVYKCSMAGAPAILRVTHSSHRLPDDIRAELDWVDFLARKNASVALPLHSRNNRLVEVLSLPDSQFIVTAFEKAPGEVPPDNPDDWDTEFVRTWGAVTGRLHALSRDYPADGPANARPRWNENDLVLDAERYLDEDDTELAGHLRRCVQSFDAVPQAQDYFGLIHGDLHHGNFFVHQGTFTVFDFDDCEHNWFLHDIAIPVYYGLRHYPDKETERRQEFVQRFFPEFLRGYTREYPLFPQMLQYMPLFMNLRDTLLYVWCCKKEIDNKAAKLRLRSNALDPDHYTAFNFPQLVP